MPYILIIAGAALLDRISKILAASKLTEITTFPLIKDVFHFTYTENTGMAFSLLSGNPFLLGVVSAVFIIILSMYFYKEYKTISPDKRKTKQSKLLFTSLSFIIGGALGNMIDRFAYGYVVDMLDFRLINFAIFNVADAFVCIGAALLILSVILEPTEKEPEKK